MLPVIAANATLVAQPHLLDAQAAPAEALPAEEQDGGIDEVELHCKQLQSADGAD